MKKYNDACVGYIVLRIHKELPSENSAIANSSETWLTISLGKRLKERIEQGEEG